MAAKCKKAVLEATSGTNGRSDVSREADFRSGVLFRDLRRSYSHSYSRPTTTKAGWAAPTPWGSAFLARDPAVDLRFQHIQWHGPVFQHFCVEFADVELAAQFLLR